jgi:hypothetical protein
MTDPELPSARLVAAYLLLFAVTVALAVYLHHLEGLTTP